MIPLPATARGRCMQRLRRIRARGAERHTGLTAHRSKRNLRQELSRKRGTASPKRASACCSASRQSNDDDRSSVAEQATDGDSSWLCGRPGLRFRVFNDRPAFETSVAGRFTLDLATDAIDESHVEAGECPCHGRIELRTTHRDLPGSRRTMYPSRQMRPNPSRFLKT